MRSRTLSLALVFLAASAGVFGAMNTFITVAGNDLALWQSYFMTGAIWLGISIAIALGTAIWARGLSRWAAVIVGLAVLYPISILIEQAPYVWP